MRKDLTTISATCARVASGKNKDRWDKHFWQCKSQRTRRKVPLNLLPVLNRRDEGNGICKTVVGMFTYCSYWKHLSKYHFIQKTFIEISLHTGNIYRNITSYRKHLSKYHFIQETFIEISLHTGNIYRNITSYRKHSSKYHFIQETFIEISLHTENIYRNITYMKTFHS